MKGQLLGREPAVIVGVIEAAIMVAVAVGILKWNTDQIGAIMAVVVIVLGLITAFLTHDTLLGLLVGLVKAGGVLLAAFGLNLSPDVTATLIALIVALAALFQRTQTSPDAGWNTQAA
jgi:hypothetical protein